MSRPKEKNSCLNPITGLRIRKHCYGNLSEFFYRYLVDHVSFDLPTFKSMLRSEWCREETEKELVIRLAAVERLIKDETTRLEFVEQGQVDWAVEGFQGPNAKDAPNA